MKNDSHSLITCASWEERFLLGLPRLLECRHHNQALILYSDEYAERTASARGKAERICKSSGIAPRQDLIYSGSPERTWKETLSPFFSSVNEGSRVLVDISTMPREIIWQTFWFLEFRKCHVDYVYNRPGGYGDWLSRDPESPRLVYKMSGLSRIGSRTALLILAGYDVDRVKHLVNRFEPAITLLGLQKDSVDEANKERMEAQQKAFSDSTAATQFWLDAYSGDHGQEDIAKVIAPYVGKYNILMASMGPKLSAVALYELHRKNESLGLVYLPSREFNPAYSHGIGESIWGSLPATE